MSADFPGATPDAPTTPPAPAAAVPALSADQAAILAAVDANFEATIAELTELVAIPSIAWEAFDANELERSSALVAELARAAGFGGVDIVRAPRPDGAAGAPAVLAEIPAPAGAPTVLLYAHHDVQPTGDEALWDSPPFVATRRGDRLFGRGTADDKAGILAHISAVRSLGERLGVGVRLFIEGEEEAGSPSFRTFLETYRARLAADLIVVADSSNWAVGVPALTTSLRGLVGLEFTVTTLDHSLHSGMFGGVAPDAATVLLKLLGTLHDEAGDVAVAGAGLHRAEAPAVDIPEATIRADAGVLDGVELLGTGSVTERLWTKPALAVIGIDLPTVALSSNVLQPTARAKVSLRLAPGESPEAALEALKRHLSEKVGFGARVEFGDVELGKPYQADTSAPSFAAMTEALGLAFGEPSVDTGLGGSIPFIADLNEVFPEAQILVTGIEDPDTRAHGANESLHLGDFRKAIGAEALLLHRLGGGA